MRDTIVVLDFGSQYAHLIAKQIRHLGIYTEIASPQSDLSAVKHAKGIILSGGPESVFDSKAPPFNKAILSADIPILGLCYGHHLISQQFGGKVENTGQGEFGKARMAQTAPSPLWTGVEFPSQVWMSHQDNVTQAPEGFEVIAQTDSCPTAALQNRDQSIFTLQFHAEVKDSLDGRTILGNFVKGVCGAQIGWSMETFIEESLQEIRETVGSRKVLMFLSGGVDSSVAFALLNEALGTDRVLGLYINNGFMRKNESEVILNRYAKQGYPNVKSWDATEAFLEAVEGLVDPQEKRHRVGATFIQIRDQFLKKLDLIPEEWMLGQGTLYPDIIESGGSEHAHVIKSHHNRVQEVQDLMEQGAVIEPLKELYKDEVRKVGELLGLPDSLVWRHPFPGPGLSINVLCANGQELFADQERIQTQIRDIIATSDYDSHLLPVRSVGVQGDQRTYNQPVVLKGPQDWEQLEQWSVTLTNQVSDVNRVVTLIAPTELPDLKIGEAYCTQPRLDILREADALANQALEDHGLMRHIFQILVILLPLSYDGFGNSVVLRPVCSEDVMTAQFAKLDWTIVNPLAQQILALPGVDAVFYDVTHKPPATFGWE